MHLFGITLLKKKKKNQEIFLLSLGWFQHTKEGTNVKFSHQIFKPLCKGPVNVNPVAPLQTWTYAWLQLHFQNYYQSLTPASLKQALGQHQCGKIAESSENNCWNIWQTDLLVTGDCIIFWVWQVPPKTCMFPNREEQGFSFVKHITVTT